VATDSALDLRRQTKKTTSATRARNRSEPTTTPTISGVLSVEVGGVTIMMVVVEDERPGFVDVDDDCALVVEFVAPTTVADVDVAAVAVVVAAKIDEVVVPRAVVDDVLVVVAAVAAVVTAMVDAVVAPIPVAVVDVDVVVVVAAVAVVDAFVVALVGGLAAVQLATGRLKQAHRVGRVEQSCGCR
jgi:hypothetical protein